MLLIFCMIFTCIQLFLYFWNFEFFHIRLTVFIPVINRNWKRLLELELKKGIGIMLMLVDLRRLVGTDARKKTLTYFCIPYLKLVNSSERFTLKVSFIKFSCICQHIHAKSVFGLGNVFRRFVTQKSDSLQ